MSKKAREWKERRLYGYRCKGCSMRRSSLKRSVRAKGMCRKCIKNHVPDNQVRLFGESL